MKPINQKILALGMILFSASALATEEVNVKVKGMVCSFCAQGIKKKFSNEKSVGSVDVNLDEKWVKLDLKDGENLADDRIRELIQEAGYNVASIERKKI